MLLFSALIERGTPVEAHRPWPRVIVDAETWREAARGLAAGDATLLGLWSDGEAVHMALVKGLEPLPDDPSHAPHRSLPPAGRDRVGGVPTSDVGGSPPPNLPRKGGRDSVVHEASQAENILPAPILVISLPCLKRRFPSVGAAHRPALRLERTIRDLYGLEPVGAPDPRPWLDHNRWGVAEPLGRREVRPPAGQSYPFLEAEGVPLHQIPVGPVHAGIIEPGHFRFTANGETVVRLEERLGYVHKGIESLMAGAALDKAAKLAARVSGDSTVAYSIAFARAVEAAVGWEPPRRAVHLRALMAELERMANHFGDIGAICNDASFSLLHAHLGALRERVLRAADACFGHRLMMDRVVPGGVSVDLGPDGAKVLATLVATVRNTFPELVELYDNTASLQDRTVSTGILKAELARQFGAGGFIGRASGRPFDARRAPGYAPYDDLDFQIPTRGEGDVDARVWVRVHEIEESLSIIEQLLAGLPDGAIQSGAGPGQRTAEGAEGSSLVEAFRGDVLVWVRIGGDGTIARAHLRDPSWFQWPLLEAAIEGNIVADFPLCNKSFNCSYSGHDV